MCGREKNTFSRFNLSSALAAIETALRAAAAPADSREEADVFILTPFTAQASLLTALIFDLDLADKVICRPLDLLPSEAADLVILDSVLDQPLTRDEWLDPGREPVLLPVLAAAVATARREFVLVGSQAWLHESGKPSGALGRLWAAMDEKALRTTVRDYDQPESVGQERAEEGSRPRLFRIDPARSMPELCRDIESAGESVFFDMAAN